MLKPTQKSNIQIFKSGWNDDKLKKHWQSMKSENEESIL